jgi:ABC-type Mn2+/Zn2+ transport system permease subunit
VNWLSEPLGYAFFVRGLIAGLALGAATGAVGVFVVLRRMSYIGHGMSHSLLGGIAVALALGHSVYLGAAAATALSALLIDRVSRARGLGGDAAIGIVTTGMFAFGVAVLGWAQASGATAESLLFGSVLGVRALDMAVALAGSAAVGVVLFTAWKRLVFTAFDPVVAAVQGVRTAWTQALLNLLVAGVVVVGVRLLGVLMIAAAVVIPAAAARLLSHRIGRVLGLAALFGALSQVAGLYVSWHADVPSGAAVVLLAVLLFLLAAFASSITRRGRLAAARRT